MMDSDPLGDNLRSRHIPALDGLRFIAVFAVMGYHFFDGVFPAGQGVTLFFVLSGLLITWLMIGERERTGGVNLRAFYWRRTLRIFPAFGVYWLAAVALLIASGNAVPWAHAIASAAYVGNYYVALNDYPQNFFSHAWSLGVEEQYYLLFPMLFVSVASRRMMIGVLSAIIAAVAVWRCELVFGWDAPDAYLYAAFDTRCDALLVGALAAVVLADRGACRRIGGWLARGWVPAAAVAGLALSIYVLPSIVDDWRNVGGLAFEPWLLLVLILAAVAGAGHAAWTRPLLWRPVVWFGVISYPLYLYQQLMIYPVKRLLEGWPTPVVFAAACAATVAAAAGSYYVVERPFLKLKKWGPGAASSRSVG